MTPLKYLTQELNFKLIEWRNLSDKDKADLKTWAAEEMRARGIEVK